MTDVLTKFEILQDLNDEGRERFAEVLEERRLDAGRTLFRTDDEAEEMFLVAEGQVRLERDGQVLGLLGPGEVLGAGSVVVIGKRECTAVAETSVQLLLLTREGYQRLRMDSPQVALVLQEGILRELGKVLRGSLSDLGRDAS